MSLKELRARPRVSREENIVRHVGGSHFDDRTGILNGSAFDRAPKDTDGLSVNRRHILAQDPLEDEAEIGKVVGSHLKMGATSQFAELNVGLMLDALDDFEQEIFVCEDPLPAVGAALENPAHALVVGLPFAGEVVGSLQSELAGDRLRKIVCHIFPAVMKAPA